MTVLQKNFFRRTWLVPILLLVMTPSMADDKADIESMLLTFLDGVTEAETHDRFWAEDLIYTSSRGTRTGKSEIMQGFDSADASNEPGPQYSAEEVQIQVYGETAIVAFRLIASPPNVGDRQEYLNTGTFLKRDGRWKAVAWQATIVPATIIPAESL